MVSSSPREEAVKIFLASVSSGVVALSSVSPHHSAHGGTI